MADLDSLVKGAPLAGHDGSVGAGPAASDAAAKAGDPLSQTPGSPSMIYLNLLVLEGSLRAQYLDLRARRRHHTFFLLVLGAWVLGFGYALFLAPREDGSGMGGSVYWVLDMFEKVCFMGGVITAVLVWATGIWDRGVRWPRRWFAVSNRGLRHINCKLVLLQRPWYAEALATLGWFLTYGVFSNTGGAASYRAVDPALLREVDRELHLSAPSGSSLGAVDEEKGHRHHHHIPAGREEDLAPGGDYVKLLLLAKPFSPTFRENWELFRQEYWERENERRALIRHKLKEQERALQRSSGGWFWWLPVFGSAGPAPAAAGRTHQHHTQRPHTPRSGGSDGGSGGGGEKHGTLQHPRHAAVEREHRRTRSTSSRRGSTSVSGTAAGTPPGAGTEPGGGPLSSVSRSSTPAIEEETTDAVSRKGSVGSSTPSERRRKKSTASSSARMTAGGGSGGGSSGSVRRPALSDSRSVTPEIPSPLAKESSFPSTGSMTEGKRSSRSG